MLLVRIHTLLVEITELQPQLQQQGVGTYSYIIAGWLPLFATPPCKYHVYSCNTFWSISILHVGPNPARPKPYPQPFGGGRACPAACLGGVVSFFQHKTAGRGPASRPDSSSSGVARVIFCLFFVEGGCREFLACCMHIICKPRRWAGGGGVCCH